MFMHWPGRRSLGIEPDRVVAVIESINTPNISIPEAGTQPTKGYIVGLATASGNFSIYCYLLMLETNHPIVYVCDTPEVTLDDYPQLEAEAIQFAESMGFMLDNMNLRARSEGEQVQLLAAFPFFLDELGPPSASVETELDEAMLGEALPLEPLQGTAAMLANVASGTPLTTGELAIAARLLSSF